MPYLVGLGMLLLALFPFVALHAGFNPEQAVSLSGIIITGLALVAEMHLVKVIVGAITTIVTAFIVVIFVLRKKK